MKKNLIFKIEFKKLIYRRDTWVMLSMIAIPIFYSIGSILKSSMITFNGDIKEYAFSYFVNMFTFVNMVFIYFIITALSSAKSLGGEIRDKSILLYTQRINDRSIIYKGKILAGIAMFTLICIVFFIVTIIMFYILSGSRTDITEKIFFKSDEILLLISRFLSIYLYYIFTIQFSIMLSTYFKSSMVAIIFAVFHITSMYISYFPGIKYLSFNYYINEISKLDPSDMLGLISLILTNIVVFGVYVILTYIVGIKKFKRMDI